MSNKSPDKSFSFSTNEEGLTLFNVYYWAFICGQRWEWRFHSSTNSRQTLKAIQIDLDNRGINHRTLKAVVDVRINQVEEYDC